MWLFIVQKKSIKFEFTILSMKFYQAENDFNKKYCIFITYSSTDAKKIN